MRLPDCSPKRPSSPEIPFRRASPDARFFDLFDGWRFLRTCDLNEDFKNGTCNLVRIVVAMPEQHVYIDNLTRTPKPEILLSGLHALSRKPTAVTYQPW